MVKLGHFFTTANGHTGLLCDPVCFIDFDALKCRSKMVGCRFDSSHLECDVSVTRCWNKKVAQLFQKFTENMPQQFLFKIVAFKVAKKSPFWLLLKENLWPKTFQNCPIESHLLGGSKENTFFC